MSLQDEFKALKSEKNSYKRARRFEVFLARLLEKEALKVTHNPRTAKPRQTDLVACGDQGFFLVEAKWTKKKFGIDDVVQVRDRLMRVPTDVFACVFSISGFSEPAVKEVSQNKSREIHLFNQIELRGMVEGGLSFQELLGKKREWLRVHGSAFLLESVPSSAPLHQLRSEPDVFEIGGTTLPWLRSRTGHNDILFSNELLDFSRRRQGSTFSLELQPKIDSLNDLQRILNRIQGLFGLSGQGAFSIHQSGEGWFGFGLESFISAAGHQKIRYNELGWESYHHSEQLAYLDRIENGGLICVTSQQSTGTNYLHSTFLEIYFPGMPVDTSNVRQLCKITRDEDAHLELVGDSPLHTCRGPLRIKVQPVGTIVSNSHGASFVSGLVIKNPFLNDALPSVDDDECGRVLGWIRESQFLLCALRDWHNTVRLMDTYRLTSVEACWIERFCAFYLVCDWD
jgi:hypothetical protein